LTTGRFALLSILSIPAEKRLFGMEQVLCVLKKMRHGEGGIFRSKFDSRRLALFHGGFTDEIRRLLFAIRAKRGEGAFL
jgi:hypothetical protein